MIPHSVDERLSELSLMLDFSDNLRDRIIDAIKEVFTYQRVEPADVILQEGDTSDDDGVIVLRGSVILTRVNGHTFQLPSPSLLGEMQQFGFYGSKERTATVTAAEPCGLLRFSWPKLYAALEARLQSDELELFREALKRYAWMHFLESEDEI